MEFIKFNYRYEEIISVPEEFPSREAFIEYFDCFHISPVEDKHSKEDEEYLKSKKEWKTTDSYPLLWKYNSPKDMEFQFSLLFEMEGNQCKVSCFFNSNNDCTMEFMKEVTNGVKFIVFLVKECFSDKLMFLRLGENELVNFWNEVERPFENKKRTTTNNTNHSNIITMNE
jgi:hypothetical protein